MRKFILLLVIVFLILVIGGFLGRDILLKYILEDRLGQINQAYVKIESVQSRPFEKFIVLNGIQMESHQKKGTDFIRIKQLKTFYDLDYNNKKVELYETEVIGLEFITPKSEELMKELRAKKSVEVVQTSLSSPSLLEDIEKEENKNLKDEIQSTNEFQNIKQAFQNMKFGKNGLSMDLDSIKENLNRIREKYISKENTNNTGVEYIVSEYLLTTYENKIYNLLLRYREIVKELEERIVKDLERNDTVWEFHMNRVSIFFDMYGINFNGEIKNFNSRLSKNHKNIPFKLFGEKNETIGMLKGELNILKLELDATADIPELDLLSIPEFQKYLVDGAAFLQQDIHLDKKDIDIDGTLVAKRMRLARNPFVEKIRDLEVKYHYNSNDRQLYLHSGFLKNKIDELENY